MLCSISTGRSGSNWLDRLRSSKGFPAGDQLDLDQFLNDHNSPNLASSSNMNKIDLKSNTNLAERPDLDGNQTTEVSEEREWFGVVSNVLSELFHMGGDTNNFSRINGKKVCRKQRNPKICVLPSSPNANHMNEGDSRDEKQMCERLKVTEHEDVNADLSAFSRTDVTVIDTSYPSWKFEKMLFRRKNVWKVRDKKCKAMSANRKKRKASLLIENAAEEEKKKLCNSSSNNENGDDGLVPSNELGHGQGNKMEEACKSTHEHVSQVQDERFPKKLKNGGSSVILIKSIPTSKKNGAVIPKSCVKSIQRQHKAY